MSPISFFLHILDSKITGKIFQILYILRISTNFTDIHATWLNFMLVDGNYLKRVFTVFKLNCKFIWGVFNFSIGRRNIVYWKNVRTIKFYNSRQIGNSQLHEQKYMYRFTTK